MFLRTRFNLIILKLTILSKLNLIGIKIKIFDLIELSSLPKSAFTQSFGTVGHALPKSHAYGWDFFLNHFSRTSLF
jgi:hypothetical protein